MTSDESDLSGMLPQLGAAFQHYHHTNYSALGVEIMKLNKETDEMSMETVHIVLLNPLAYESLSELLPLMHNPKTRALLMDVMQEVLDRLEEQEKNQENDPDPFE